MTALIGFFGLGIAELIILGGIGALIAAVIVFVVGRGGRGDDDGSES